MNRILFAKRVVIYSLIMVVCIYTFDALQEDTLNADLWSQDRVIEFRYFSMIGVLFSISWAWVFSQFVEK